MTQEALLTVKSTTIQPLEDTSQISLHLFDNNTAVDSIGSYNANDNGISYVLSLGDTGKAADGSGWRHMVITSEGTGGNIIIYNNNESSSVSNPGTTANYNASPLQFTFGDQTNAGVIDNIRVFNRALTSSEVNFLYTEVK